MSDRIDVATRKGLFTVERTGASAAGWRITAVDFLGDNVSTVLTDRRDGSRYAALEHGHFGCKLHRKAAGETAWSEVAVPVYPKQPDGEVDIDPMGRTIRWSLIKMWVLEAGGADEPGTLWTGTLPGGLFRSRDHGASWDFMRSLWDQPDRKFWMGGGYDAPGINSVAVDPRASGTVRIGLSCGGVWITRDGGASWIANTKGMRAEYCPPEHVEAPASQDIHRFVQGRQDPDTFWVQHHNGIFVSRDGAQSWREITTAGPSTFGFTAAVDPTASATAWFAPAIKDEKRIPVDGRMVVTRTRDGGQSFETLGEGLPDTHAYHLVYRHGLDVDQSGRRLAMGSTTGGLWVSETAGETWSCISRDLPPVHAVRFA